ncbi:CapA family protein [bacterium]|nr:CapA family protein [bacterium]
MFLNLISCDLLNIRNTENQKNITGQDGNTGTNSSEPGEGNNSSGKDFADSANKTEKDRKQTIILIKNTIPSFITTVIKREINNIFDDADIKEGETAGEIKDYSIVVDIAAPDNTLKNYIVFCAVTDFYNLCDDISAEEFKEYWSGNLKSIESLSEQVKVGGSIKNTDINGSTTTANSGSDLSNNKETVLFLTRETENIISIVFGDKKNNNIKVISSGEIKNGLEENPNSFAIIPFEELRKELKVLNVNGKSVFDKDFSYGSYPFSFSVSFSGYDSEKSVRLKKAFETEFFSNRDPDKMAVVNMTGVTALVRGVANRMDLKGVLYPGEKIANILKNADITHISNEISFKEDCNAGQSGTTFCSKPGYIELLKSVGADLIELTGNHLNDYGSQYLENTLKIYNELGWKHFGGGINLALSKEPALYEINGNKIAFLGFNQFGPAYDWATRNSAGSAPPDNPYYISEIKRLKEQGCNVIFTFQYEESYSYSPLDMQVEDFRAMRDAGADIVNGSQAHQPMGFEITKEGLICYGLGNLFFDQMQSLGTRQGIIARHIFYNGKHISTQLIPTIIDDYCQPRLMNETEKKELLRSLYEASFK